MKKLLIGGIVAALSFLAGLAGLYFAVPYVAPDRAEEARLLVDSLAAAGQLDPTALPDSSATGLAAALLPDAPVPAASAPDSLNVRPDSTAPATVLPAVPASPVATRSAVEDSLRSRLRTAEQERETLAAQLEALQQAEQRRTQVREATSADVAELAKTLAGLDDRELNAILAKLDLDVVRALYDRTSGRNRTRLLQAMPADRAARFVQSLVRPDPSPAAARPVATAAAQDATASIDSP